MKIFTISAVLTCLMASASAQTPYAHFTLEGSDGIGNYPNYTISVPEDNTKNAINNDMVVFTIIPAEDGYDCDFFGASGSVTDVGPTSDVDPPQPQISVNCYPPGE